jgi:hypothetical protein
VRKKKAGKSAKPAAKSESEQTEANEDGSAD